MVKSYLRYEPVGGFGVINAPQCNVVTAARGSVAICGALADVAVWHLKRGILLRKFHVDRTLGTEVTCVAVNASETRIAAGYEDGTIRIWNLQDLDLTTGRHSDGSGLVVALNGHRKAVTCVAFNDTGSLLVSGSRDTDVVVWDVVSQSGLFRLRGHRDEVTAAAFFGDSKRLVTASKDTFLKVWDLDTQHCVQTCVNHRTEVWALSINPDETRLVTGSGDSQMRVWQLDVEGLLPPPQQPSAPAVEADAGAAGSGEGKDSAMDVEDSTPSHLYLALLGPITRTSNQRVQTVAYSKDGSMLLCQAAGKSVELYKIRGAEQAKKRLNRRRKRLREKVKAAQAALSKAQKKKKEKMQLEQLEAALLKAQAAVEAVVPVPTDEFELLTVVHNTHKNRAAAFCVDGLRRAEGSVQLLLAGLSNQLDVFTVHVAEDSEPGAASFSKASSVTLPGHRGAVRALAVSGDDRMVLTVAKTTAKVWDAATGQCIRTLATGFGLCCAFGPEDRHAIIGCKNGHVQLFHLGSGDLLEDHEAHDGAVWSLAVRPDGKGMVTGSADKSVQFWTFEASEASGLGATRLGLEHVRTLKMTDDVLSVCYSNTKDPTRLLLAVALLDCTVKVFFEDSLKFFLSLYGHKLPVMSMDISSDNSFLVTASADKNVKLWGLDFGDCHKSLFAHADSVMSVAFIPGTHLFFSAGKDGVVNYWDADRFELILSLSGHRGEVWCAACAHDGSYVVSGSHDRSVRVWKRSEGQVFLEEEKEKRLEEMFERSQREGAAAASAAGKDGIAGAAESGRAGMRSESTVKAADGLLEALELVRTELGVWREYAQDLAAAKAAAGGGGGRAKRARGEVDVEGSAMVPAPTPSPLLMGKTPSAYLLKELTGVKAADLEEALVALPFSAARELLRYLLTWTRQGLQPELCAKCVLRLVRLHMNQLSVDGSLREQLVALSTFTRSSITACRDRAGFNKAALQHFQAQFAADGNDFGEQAAPEIAEESSFVRQGKRRRYALF